MNFKQEFESATNRAKGLAPQRSDYVIIEMYREIERLRSSQSELMTVEDWRSREGITRREAGERICAADYSVRDWGKAGWYFYETADRVEILKPLHRFVKRRAAA